MPQYIAVDTILTVPFAEVDPGRDEDFTAKSFNASRTLRCAWDDRFKLAEELVGGITGNATVVNIIRGHRFPGKPEALANSVKIKGVGRSSEESASVLKYEEADLVTAYMVPDEIDDPSSEGDQDDLLITESLSPAAEFLTLPGRELFFDEGGTKKPLPENFGLSKLIMLTDWVYTIHQSPVIPSLFFDPVNPLVGKVNDKCIKSLRLSEEEEVIKFDAETLLMQSPDLEREITSAGVGAWRITVRMTWNPEGWNKFQRTAVTTPAKLVNAAGEEQDIYKLGDFLSVINAQLVTCD